MRSARDNIAPDSTDNRRRLDREPVDIKAVLDTPGGDMIQGGISDFCRTGVYLRFAAPNPGGAHLLPLPGSASRLIFGTGRGKQAKKHSLECRIAHVSEDGVGLYIPNMPATSHECLSRASGNRGSAPTRSSAPRADLLAQCHALTRAAMTEMFQDLFIRLDNYLTSAHLEASFMEQPRYEHAAYLFKHQRPVIETRYMGMLGEALQAIESGRQPPKYERSESEGELSLVEDAEFEDWLAQTTVVSHVEARLLQNLGRLQPAYDGAAGLGLNRKALPFGPETLSHCFGHAIADLEFMHDIRQIAYKALSVSLQIKLPALYDELERILAPVTPKPAKRLNHPAGTAATSAKGVDASAPQAEGPTRTDSPSAQSAPAQDIPEINQLLEKLIGDYAPGRQGGNLIQASQEGMPYNLSNILSVLNQANAPTGAPGNMGIGRTERGAAPLEQHGAELWPNQPGYASLIQVAQLVRDAYQQLANRAGGADPLPAARSATGNTQSPSLPQLLASLDQFPALPAEDLGGKHIPLAERLSAHLGRQLQSPLPTREKSTLDTMSRLLDLAGAEHPASSQIEPLLRTLERPLLKLSLTDPEFLSAPHHQAKRMMSLLDQYSIAANDLGRFFDPKLHQFLNSLLDRVTARADSDPEIYAKANVYLERMLTPIQNSRRRRVALLQETCEGKERVKAARTRTSTMLEQLLGNRSVPASMIKLLDLGWRQYLVLMELRQGINHPDWHRGKAALNMLLDWLDSLPGKAAPSSQSVAELLGYIEQQLATVNVDTQLIESYLDELGQALIGLRHGQKPRMVRVPGGRFTPKPVSSDSPAPDILADLKIGQWWHFNRNSQMMAMQLIWQSTPPGQCAFANRSATQKIELSLSEFDQRIATGLISPAENKDQPLFERSAHVIIDDVYKQLSHEVSHDPVTGLINRKGFMQKLQQLAALRDDQTHYVCILEFDQFRVIYNNCGVEAGEALARKLGEELAAQAGEHDVVAAIQDDIFALLVYQRNRIQILEFAGKLLKVFQNFRYDHGQERYSIGVNIGLAEYVSMHDTPEEVMKNADSACISARKVGRNRMQRYDPSNEQLRMQQFLMDLAGRIDQIVQEQGLYLRCQRVVPLNESAGLESYYEILLGIRDKDEEIRPLKFLSAVERWQRGHEIDMWVIQNTFEWIEAHLGQFENSAGFAINLSPSSLDNGDFLSYLQDKLNNASFSLSKLTFEITETSTLGTYRAAQEFIRLIRRFGCKFSLDDVGSGFSSFAHLKNLRTDSLKIDGIFVKDCVNNPSDLAMVKSMNEIGHALGMKTIAEYVESEEIMDKLRTIGVDYVQGYALHKPIPLDQLVLGEPASKRVKPVQAPVKTPPEPRAASVQTRLSDSITRRHTWRNPNSGGLGQP
jgi:diguanylate cyclase (GGDEF)-like protein